MKNLDFFNGPETLQEGALVAAFRVGHWLKLGPSGIIKLIAACNVNGFAMALHWKVVAKSPFFKGIRVLMIICSVF